MCTLEGGREGHRSWWVFRGRGGRRAWTGYHCGCTSRRAGNVVGDLDRHGVRVWAMARRRRHLAPRASFASGASAAAGGIRGAWRLRAAPPPPTFLSPPRHATGHSARQRQWSAMSPTPCYVPSVATCQNALTAARRPPIINEQVIQYTYNGLRSVRLGLASSFNLTLFGV